MTEPTEIITEPIVSEQHNAEIISEPTNDNINIQEISSDTIVELPAEEPKLTFLNRPQVPLREYELNRFDLQKQYPYVGKCEITLDDFPKFTMYSNNDDEVVNYLLWTDFRGWEAISIRIWYELMRDYSIKNNGVGTALDIGSYTGIFSLTAAQYLNDVHAFELVSNISNRLKRNVEENKLDNIRVNNMGVSDSNKEHTYFEFVHSDPDILSSGASLVKINEVREEKQVQLCKIDSYCTIEHITKVAGIKVDVEAAEWQVINGMTQTIARSYPDMIIELWDNKVEKINAVLKAFPKYNVYLLIDETNKIFKLTNLNNVKIEMLTVNALFTTKSKEIMLEHFKNITKNIKVEFSDIGG